MKQVSVLSQTADRAAGPARGGMVTSPHVLASEAGLKVLQRGGTAIEAAIATGAVLSVVYPHFCGLGGDGVWMVAERDRPARCFLGIGQAARHLPDVDPIPQRGPLSASTTAGLVDSWDHALRVSRRDWGGSESLASLLEDAIVYASDGIEVSASQRFWTAFRAQDSAGWPGFETAFGTAATAGGRFVQAQLADVLRGIADQGARDFYEGRLAARIARGLAAAGSPLDAIDLAATATREVQPLALDYRGTTLWAPPPPTQGVTTLGIMGVLAHFPMADFDPTGADFFHLCVEAVKQAFLDRGRIADPDFAEAVTPSLARDHLATKAAAIDPRRAMAWPHALQTGDTAFIGVADARGRSVSLLQSLYFDWGSGVVAGDTGILWQNRGAAFDRSADGPNRWQAGKRPFYTLNPGIATRGERPVLVYGTQGADGQPQTLAVLLSRLLDHGLDPLVALAAPRFLLGRTFSDTRDTLKLEADAGPAVFADLAARGHDISALPAASPLAGHPGLIQIDSEGLMRGAHDPRSDGCALGLAGADDPTAQIGSARRPS